MTNIINKLQYVYLGISLISWFCTITKLYIIPCSNFVALMCLFDLFYLKKKDMIFHHILVLLMIHYMNNHSNVKNREEIILPILKTEISTTFLIINNLLENKSNMGIIKNINRIIFVYCFIYYRIYNYLFYLILVIDYDNVFLNYSKNNFEYFEIYFSIYGLFILNLYWCRLIINKIISKLKS